MTNLLLQHTLAQAVTDVVGIRDNGYMLVIHPYDVCGANKTQWKTFLKEAAFKIIARQLDTPSSNLIMRAIRMLDQSGEILWDDPETPEDVEAEQPWIDRETVATNKIKLQATRRAKHFAAANLIVLTEKQKERIADPYHEPKLTENIASVLQYVPPAPHYSYDWGLDLGGHVAQSRIVNAYLREGVMELVEAHKSGHAYLSLIRPGPKYIAALKKYRIRVRPHNGTAIKAYLNANVNLRDYDYSKG